MSIYTPVFPQTEPRPLEASQSSSVSDSPATARRPQAVSYTSRLSHWHLSIATLPEELCPASEPSSPASKERSANLQTVIGYKLLAATILGQGKNAWQAEIDAAAEVRFPPISTAAPSTDKLDS